MEFYQVLAKYYDEIFPLKEQQKQFLRDYLNQEKIQSVLDVGCATGSYVQELSSWGLTTCGVDLSEQMIAIARHKSREHTNAAKFLTADMLDLKHVPGRYDGVLCLGNTLAHLTREDQLKQALQEFAAKGSHLLVQVVNYDRVLIQKVTELPEIATPTLVFRRYYTHLPDGLIKFSMEIDLPGLGKKAGAANLLAPLTREKLSRVMQEASWEPVSWWGSFTAEAWSDTAQATIVAARFNGRS